jgi:carbamoyl-phosphate synthase large subunit
MKSVGETMAIGRTFKEALQKALRGLEIGRFGLGCRPGGPPGAAADESRAEALLARRTRSASSTCATRCGGMSVDEIYERTKIDPVVPRRT